ncbi:MAG: diacylglycerol kinase family lipid kinase [Deltaproteobacteria bacterium]|nr:diacylglycerol kinase family lipid kinase [Deltaproteobacteria bacterium]
MTTDGFKTLVVVNPNSSNGRTGRIWPDLQAELSKRIGTFEHRFTSRQGEGEALARDALQAGFEMVVSVGGDGTHSEVANGFFADGIPIRTDAVLGVVTSGTGGDLRRTLGMDKGPFAALDRLSGTTVRPHDVGRYTFVDAQGVRRTRVFINILSFGIGGLVDKLVNSTTKALGGKASFFIATLRALARFSPPEVTVELDEGEPRTARIHNVAVAIGRFFGGGMEVAPEARPDDGLFDVVGFEGMSTFGFVSLGGSIYKGRHLARPNVTLARARRIVARCDQAEVLLDVDGEQPGRLPLEIEILPGALKIKS